MKVLFISKYRISEPLGMMYLSSYLKKNGHDCDFIDTKFEEEDNIISEVKKISPDIIAYSITTGEDKFYQQLNEKLKKNVNFISFFGGAHCTFYPEFINETGVDIICRGEGEIPLLELANKLEKKEDITKIENLWVKKDGKIHKNEIRNFIENLDDLPFPDRELINKYKQYRKMKVRRFLTMRGCLYDCPYCYIYAYRRMYKNKGKFVRQRSVNNVIEELKVIKERYNPKSIEFVDDVFIVTQDWILDFCEKYKSSIGLPFIMHARIEQINEKVVKALKEANCNLIRYGIESGNENFRMKLLNRQISQERIIETSKLFNKYKIKTLTFNMVGLPGETLDMAFETLALNIKCKPSYSWTSVFTPYPGTGLADYSKNQGFFDGDYKKVGETYFNNSVMKIKDIKKMERLRQLFALTVTFPSIMPVTKLLINLPLNKFYEFIWNAHRAYSYLFRVNTMNFSEVINYLLGRT